MNRRRIASRVVCNGALMATAAALSMLYPTASRAAPDCKEVETSFAFFDTKKSAWVESEQIRLLQCDDHLELALVKTATHEELQRVRIDAPAKGQRWAFDGCTCNEPKRRGPTRAKLVLSPIVTDAEALKPRQAWAVDPRKQTFEKLNASALRCYRDEP